MGSGPHFPLNSDLTLFSRSAFEHHRRQGVLVDQHVDDRRLAAVESPLDRAFEVPRASDLLAVRTEDLRERAEVGILVIDGEEAPAIVLVLESALVAEPL